MDMGEKQKFYFTAVLVCLAILMLSVPAMAVYTNQKAINAQVGQGQTVKFYIPMEDQGSNDIIHEGDINSWVSHPVTIGSWDWLEVTITVPDNADIRSYTETIKADGNVISKITIYVNENEIPKLNIISTDLDRIEEDTNNIGSSINGFSERIDTMENAISDMQDKVNVMATHQENVDDVRDGLNTQIGLLNQRIFEIENDNSALTTENDELTGISGMLTVNWSSAGFVFGILVGIVAAILYFRGGMSGLKFNMPRFPRIAKSMKSPSSHTYNSFNNIPESDYEEPAPNRQKSDRIRELGNFRYDFNKR